MKPIETTTALAIALALTASTALAVTDWLNLTPDQEIELALSAAPEHLREGTAVYVLGAKGFERVRDSSNGFSCLVLRTGKTLAPVCYDAEGGRTTLLANFRQAALAASGMATEDVHAAIEVEYEEGTLSAPQRPGIAYMLSPDFVRVDPETGAAEQVFPPHLMFYAPYLRNEDFGALPEHTGGLNRPWVLNEGQPTALLIMVPSAHSDG